MKGMISWLGSSVWLRAFLLVFVMAAIACTSYVYQKKALPFTSAAPEVAELTGKSLSFQEYSTYFRKVAFAKGPVYAFRVLGSAPFAPGTDLHLLGHVVGDVLYKQEGLAGMKYCTQDFRNACSHSIVVGYLEEHGEGSLPQIVQTCKEAPGGPGAYTMCFHGLGHGVLAFVGYDFERAITLCQKTGTPKSGNREYIECVGGASMEMMAGVHDPTVWEKQKAKYFKDADPLYPCTAPFMPEDAKPACLQYLTPHLFSVSGNDLGRLDPRLFPKAMAYCDGLPAGARALRAACYGGFGKEFDGYVQGRDIRDIGTTPDESLQKILGWCALAGNHFGEVSCNSSALASLFWGGENNPRAAIHFCGLSRMELQLQCYNQLVSHVHFYLAGNPKARVVCDALPEPYREQCSTGL